MFRGVCSQTGSMKVKELQTVMLVVDVREFIVNSSTFTTLQDSISAETLTLGRIQTHSFCTVHINYSQDW